MALEWHYKFFVQVFDLISLSIIENLQHTQCHLALFENESDSLTNMLETRDF